MANEGATVAAHVKILYSLVVILIIGEIGSYYYSLYLYTSLQEECSRPHFNPVSPSTAVPEEPLRRKRSDGSMRIERAQHPKGQEDWVWLNDYARVPRDAMEKMCKDAANYCRTAHPNLIGPPGVDGSKGDRGDRGEKGEKGEEGYLGYPGNPGEPGAPGPPGPIGAKGLDGRHGLAGIPGLDGVPGRDGVDGIPGRNGTHGLPGLHGKSGFNGTDGRPGDTGPSGAPGLKGSPGLPGPKGKKGLDGKPGLPGEPGVRVWMVNGTEAKSIIVPPVIADKTNNTVVSVTEGSNLRLHCTAAGTPTPEIVWRREGNGLIQLGAWQASSVVGRTLNITQVNRKHIGRYMCIASNGVPPFDVKHVDVEVLFSPMITVRRPYVETRIRGTVTLACDIEAFPDSLNSWHDQNDHFIEPNSKFNITEHVDPNVAYQTRFTLQILDVSRVDLQQYKCVSHNAHGTATGYVDAYDPAIKNITGKNEPRQHGTTPPPTSGYDEICEAQVACPECPTIKESAPCHNLPIDVHLVEPVAGLTTVLNRTNDCFVYRIGKPVLHRHTEANYGSWMRDAGPSHENQDKYWATNANKTDYLYEYANKSAFRFNKPTRVHKLPSPFQGNGHVVYNGFFFYHHNGTRQIIRYGLSGQQSTEPLSLNISNQYAALEGNQHLYRTNYSYVDIAADENGLWAVYGHQDGNKTFVTFFWPDTMRAAHTWLLSLKNSEIGDTFIACGVLYILDKTTTHKATVAVAFDLFRNTVLVAGSSFTNPFSFNTMVSYNARDKAIFSWDKGHQLTYPILYTSISASRLRDVDQSTR